MLLILVVAFATGFLSKLVDLIEEHDMKLSRHVSKASGIIYGALIAYVISISPELSALWIATVVGVLVTGKIDTTGHYLGLGSMILLLPVLGIAGINIIHLVIFTAVCIAEEAINDNIVDKGKLKSKQLTSFMGLRPLLEITALIIAIITWQWIIWFGLLSYDIGYIFVEKFNERK